MCWEIYVGRPWFSCYGGWSFFNSRLAYFFFVTSTMQVLLQAVFTDLGCYISWEKSFYSKRGELGDGFFLCWIKDYKARIKRQSLLYSCHCMYLWMCLDGITRVIYSVYSGGLFFFKNKSLIDWLFIGLMLHHPPWSPTSVGN